MTHDCYNQDIFIQQPWDNQLSFFQNQGWKFSSKPWFRKDCFFLGFLACQEQTEKPGLHLDSHTQIALLNSTRVSLHCFFFRKQWTDNFKMKSCTNLYKPNSSQHSLHSFHSGPKISTLTCIAFTNCSVGHRSLHLFITFGRFFLRYWRERPYSSEGEWCLLASHSETELSLHALCSAQPSIKQISTSLQCNLTFLLTYINSQYGHKSDLVCTSER